ncbi:RNA-directed DNA polymerase, eukaryota, reverse transcriptase zinc-binding domain protein [Tanacetum coccineum]|uniref:RNA-directed DNA polymerase, eukaryota, reverse transcriptase zinc-binding domain protein n=1 Tax=Tanacetum coccineum TaxID=301880 RepID=A0ABQ5BNR1_9ASTR
MYRTLNEKYPKEKFKRRFKIAVLINLRDRMVFLLASIGTSALIPKIPDANLVKDFRPISLIGSIYKIIAKILANRLISVLGDIVSDVQSAFITGRQMLDGPFILNEVLQWCTKKKRKSLIFKVDFEKAFDSVRWDFLDDFLKKYVLRVTNGVIGSKVVSFLQGLNHLRMVVQQRISISQRIKTSEDLGYPIENEKLFPLEAVNLLKSVLGSIPVFHMSLFKVPSKVLNLLESIRSQFFNGQNLGSRKASWVKWHNVLMLGVSSLFSLNRGLMLKWVWKFLTQKDSLWTKVIVAIHGVDGKVHSTWVPSGNGESTKFWLDHWHEGGVLKNSFPIMFALENHKEISVSYKLGNPNLYSSFRRIPRGGAEQNQFDSLLELVSSVNLVPLADRWVWKLEGTGVFFSVASARRLFDELRLPNLGMET